VAIGIDLGTTYSAVAIVDPGSQQPRIIPNSAGDSITPSVIQYINGSFVFGREALSAFISAAPGCAAAFKRQMGSPEKIYQLGSESYSPQELSALLLRHLKEEAEANLGETITEAVITVPAYFYTPEREATKQAAEAAGLKVKKIIDEPNAAALAYGLGSWRENANILVYDLGGGTFDITLIRMAGDGKLLTVATRGDHLLGGRDWDTRLEELLCHKIEHESGIKVANHPTWLAAVRGITEGVKLRLTAMPNAPTTVTLPQHGKVALTVSRREFEEVTSDLLERTGSLCRQLLREVGITREHIADTLLVGGSTRMPGVSLYLTELLGKKPIAHINPDEAVALGAAIQATKQPEGFHQLTVLVNNDGRKSTDLRGVGLASLADTSAPVQTARRLQGIGSISLRETTAHALGIVAVSPEGTHYHNEIIIPANHPRPVRSARGFTFRTSPRSPNIMEIYLLQGDQENPLDCHFMPEKYIVSGIRHLGAQQGKTFMRVQYSYDANGIIQVAARQEQDATDLPIRREALDQDLSRFGRPIYHEEETTFRELAMVLALDVSGSMQGKPLAAAQEAMCDFVSNLDFTHTQLGVVAVSDRAEVVLPLSRDPDLCYTAIRSIKCGLTGRSNRGNPFATILEMLQGEAGRRCAIVLADGVWRYQDKAIADAKLCHEVDIETAAIGFGSADKNFLAAISSSDANALLVAQEELSQAFGTIAQSLIKNREAESRVGQDSQVEPW